MLLVIRELIFCNRDQSRLDFLTQLFYGIIVRHCVVGHAVPGLGTLYCIKTCNRVLFPVLTGLSCNLFEISPKNENLKTGLYRVFFSKIGK